ncbi:hypothetical protein C0J52_18875, partial [Blattella germanica]
FFAGTVISTALATISALTAWFFSWFWSWFWFWFTFTAAAVTTRNGFFTGAVIPAALAAISAFTAWAVVLALPITGVAFGVPDKRSRTRPCSMLLRCCNGRTSGHHQNEGRIRRELDQLMGILVVCCLQGIRCFRYCCCRYQEQIPRWCCHLRCSCYCLHSHCFASRLVLVVVVLVRFHCCCCHFRERIPHWCCRLHCFYCCLHFHCFLLDSCLDPPNRRCRIWNSKREVKDRPCSMLLHCCNGRTSGHHQNEGRIRRELDQLMGILVVCCLQGIRCSRYCYYHFQEQIPRWCCRLHCSCCCLHYHRHHLHCFHLFLERNLRLLAGHK